MGRQTDTKRVAEEVAKVAEACDILRARASVFGREVDARVINRPRLVNVASWVTEHENRRNFGLERA